MFMEELERERQSCGYTQADFAVKLGFSERTYRGYVNRERPMSASYQVHVAHTLRSPRLALAMLAEFVENPFAPVVLSVDDHPAMELYVAMAELKEAVEAVYRVNPSKPDTKAAERAMDQMMDLIHLIPAVAESWHRCYGVDVYLVRSRNLAKLQARGYYRKEAATVCA